MQTSRIENLNAPCEQQQGISSITMGSSVRNFFLERTTNVYGFWQTVTIRQKSNMMEKAQSRE